LIHAELRIDDSVIMLTDESDGAAPARSPQSLGGIVSAIMSTDWSDVDAAEQQAVAASAEVIYPLADRPYGG
jgi:PhnB protein